MNNNGVLDLPEFEVLAKKLDVHHSTIFSCFAQADIGQKGYLTISEFVNAYEKLYLQKLSDSSMADGDDENSSFIRAVRYGIDKSSRSQSFVMQMYTGSIQTLTHFHDLLNEKVKRVKAMEESENSEEIKQSFNVLPFSGDLKTIVSMMQNDSRDNSLYGSKIMWWIDVSVRQVNEINVSSLIDTFGIPSDLDQVFFGANTGKTGRFTESV